MMQLTSEAIRYRHVTALPVVSPRNERAGYKETVKTVVTQLHNATRRNKLH
jgi:hypothetical protein